MALSYRPRNFFSIMARGPWRVGGELRRMARVGEAESTKGKGASLLARVSKATSLFVIMSMLALGGALSVTSVAAQTAQKHAVPSSSGKKRHTARLKAATPSVELPVASPDPPPPPAPLTPAQMPPQPPQVTWDGKELTITSDNSTLGDILIAIRRLTGADLDIPTKNSNERIAARLGPGPAREIISTLLSWTDFDYVIQASDTDAAGIRSVLLTPRGKSEATVASASAGVPADTPARAAYRSYAHPNPNKPEEASTPESPAATQTEAVMESVPPGGQPAPTDSQSAIEAATPTGAELPVTSPVAPALSADAHTNQTLPNQSQPNQSQPDQTELTASAAVSDSSAQAPMSESEQRIQQMQNMFQQRKQMVEDSRKPPAN
jgi:hypothetical protein